MRALVPLVQFQRLLSRSGFAGRLNPLGGRTTPVVGLGAFITFAAVATTLALAGCAGLNTLTSSVATYGTWPGDKVPGTYTFDRLPSQQANPARQQSLEAAAAQALDSLGFRPAPEGAKGEVTVQLGARIERFEVAPWDDPFWAPGFHRGPWGRHWIGPGPYALRGPFGPYWGDWPANDPYLREVALLIRDGESGQPLFEARAVNDGNTDGGGRVLAAMFDAAVKDFPRADGKPHDVTVPFTFAPTPAPAAAPAASATAS